MRTIEELCYQNIEREEVTLQGVFSCWPSQRRFNVRTLVVIFLCFYSLIDDYHYGSTHVSLSWYLSYIFSDRYIIAYTGFYACVCIVLCLCRCPFTWSVRIVTSQSKGTGATFLLQQLALDSIIINL